MKIIPLHDRVIVKPNLDPEKSHGGIFIPESARRKMGEAEVVAVGPGRLYESKFRETEVKAGQKVVYPKYAGTNATVEGEDLLVFREDELLGVYES